MGWEQCNRMDEKYQGITQRGMKRDRASPCVTSPVTNKVSPKERGIKANFTSSTAQCRLGQRNLPSSRLTQCSAGAGLDSTAASQRMLLVLSSFCISAWLSQVGPRCLGGQGEGHSLN